MKKLTAEETLKFMIELLTQALEELEDSVEEGNEFVYGEKTAYVECLQWLQNWNKASLNGLDYNIEKRFVL